MRAHPNPLTSGETVALALGGAAVVAVGVVLLTRKSSAKTAPPRTANALDNYVLVIVSTTAQAFPTSATLLPILQSFPGFSGASITNITQSADLKTVTVSFTAPPTTDAQMAAWSQMAGPAGASYDLSDVGIAVQ